MSAFLTGFWVAISLVSAEVFGVAKETWGAVGMASVGALGWVLGKRKPTKGCKP